MDEDEFLEELMARYAVSKAKHDACEHNYVKDEKLSNMSDKHVFEVCTGCGWAKML